MKQIELDVREISEEPDEASAAKFADLLASDHDAAEKHASVVPGQDISASVRADKSSASMGGVGRVFFPCNREDALVMLGSLCISEFLPDQSIQLAIQPAGVALVDQGLRHTEEEMLKAGRPERFPILVEVAQNVAQEGPRVIEYKDILRLIFRNQTEADEFRFRPVDEFDTETFGFLIDGELFGLEGNPRFAIRSTDDDSKYQIGRAADRLAAGVHCVLSLGNARPQCREAIAGFLAGKNDGLIGHEEIDFVASARIATGQSLDVSTTEHQQAIVSAFAEAESSAPRILIEEVSRRLLLIAGSDEESTRRESRWAEIARNVVKSRIELNGDQLSDDKSVLLRAALLGAVVGKVDALSAFLDAEKPSGPRVTTTAAFLVGLKQGLINASWKDKKSQAQQLSSLSGIMVRALATTSRNVGNLFSLAMSETDTTTTLLVSAGDIRLAEWVEKKHVPPDAVSLHWLNEFARLGYQLIGPGRETYCWIIQLSDVFSAEVIRLQFGSVEFPSFRYHLPEGARLKKPKDLTGILGQPGCFWHPFRESEDKEMLYCDLVSLPTKSELGSLAAQLDHTLGLCLLKGKVRKSRARKPPSP